MTRMPRCPRLAMCHEARPPDQKPRPLIGARQIERAPSCIGRRTIGAIRARRPGGAPRGKGEARRVPGSVIDARRGYLGAANRGRGRLGSGEHVCARRAIQARSGGGPGSQRIGLAGSVTDARWGIGAQRQGGVRGRADAGRLRGSGTDAGRAIRMERTGGSQESRCWPGSETGRPTPAGYLDTADRSCPAESEGQAELGESRLTPAGLSGHGGREGQRKPMLAGLGERG